MAEHRPRLYVLAGANGAGKSSIGGAIFRQLGGSYFDPEEVARAIRARRPELSGVEANSEAWHAGKRLLERAIAEKLDFAFETTLGGRTLTALLEQAADADIEVRVWFAGLATAELHIARVRARTAHGGHDIPEADIRQRYDASRENVIRLLAKLTELRVYDNSADAAPEIGATPKPMLVLHWQRGRIRGPTDLSHTPRWARPIVAAAIRLTSRR